MADDDNQDVNRRGPMVALVVVVVLVAVSWYLVNTLYSDGKMQDCLMSGRTNCAPIAPASH